MSDFRLNLPGSRPQPERLLLLPATPLQHPQHLLLQLFLPRSREISSDLRDNDIPQALAEMVAQPGLATTTQVAFMGNSFLLSNFRACRPAPRQATIIGQQVDRGDLGQ